jgi:AbrB family looped-hinge helix DNA binding protein
MTGANFKKWDSLRFPRFIRYLTSLPNCSIIGLSLTSQENRNDMPEAQESNISRVRVDSAGRIVIPAEMRQSLGIQPGQDLILSGDGRGIHLQTFLQAAKAAQEAFAPYRPEGVSIVDELIRERRDEARREYRE